MFALFYKKKVYFDFILILIFNKCLFEFKNESNVLII